MIYPPTFELLYCGKTKSKLNQIMLVVRWNYCSETLL